MTRWMAVLGVILTVTASPRAMAQDRIVTGVKAPGFTVEQLNEVPFTLDDTPTVIWFFASWCSYMGQVYPDMGRDCDNAATRLKSAHRDYGDQFRWIGISFASAVTRKDVGTYRMKHEIPFALAIDKGRDVWANYGVRYAPTVIIVNNGKVVYRAQATLEDLEVTIDALARSRY